MNELLSEIKKNFRGDVSNDEKTLQEFSRDASIFEVRPKLVTFPKDARDIQNLVKFVKKRKGLSLTGRAAGTDMTGGPLTESIVVSFTKYINKIKKIGAHNAIVEPGVYYRDLEKLMDKKGLIYPSYPASKSLCAMGGIIANNSGGEKSLVYGQTVDHVNRLKVVLEDGEIHELKKLNRKELNKKISKKDFEGKIYREVYKLCEDNYDLIQSAKPKVSKNSCGYFLWKVWDRKNFDLSKVFVGSQGTLGLWLEADINLVKKKKHTKLIVASLQNLNQIASLVNIAKKYNPESLESFDRHTLKLALEFMPEIARKIHKNLISFLWEFRREAENVLLHGMPVFIVLIEISGDEENEIQKRINLLSRELTANSIQNLEMENSEESEKYWIIRRESFNLLRQKVKDKIAAPFIDDFSVKPEYLSRFLPELYELLEKNDITPTLAGHVGDGNFHIIPLLDLKKEKKKIPFVLEKFEKLVKKYEGTITAEHNDGLIRTPYVRSQYGNKMFELFQRLKEIFDKENIFNPGKKVNGNIKFAMSHIRSK